MGRPYYPAQMPDGVVLYVDHGQRSMISLATVYYFLQKCTGSVGVIMKIAGVGGQARIYRTEGGKFAARYPDESGAPTGYFKTIAGALDDAYRMLLQTQNPCGSYPPAGISRWQIADPVAGLVLDDDIRLFTRSHQSKGGDCFVPCPLSKAVHELKRGGNARIYVRAQGADEGQFVCIKRTGEKTARYSVRTPWWSERWEPGHRWAECKALKSALEDASVRARELPKRPERADKTG